MSKADRPLKAAKVENFSIKGPMIIGPLIEKVRQEFVLSIKCIELVLLPLRPRLEGAERGVVLWDRRGD